MGGVPEFAVRDAKNIGNVDDWIAWQKAQATAAGVGLTLIPGAHVATLTADIAFVLHKMAVAAWGVGAIMGCEVDGDADIQAILGIWSGAITEDALRAASEAAQVGLVAGGLGLFGYWVVATHQVTKFVGMGAGYLAQELSREIGLGAIAPLADKVGDATVQYAVQKISLKLAGKLNAKVATKVAAKFAAKMAGAITGFLPLVGPTIAGVVNWKFVSSISNAAKLYYHYKLQASAKKA